MSGLKEIASVAVKVAAGNALKAKGTTGKFLSTIAGLAAGAAVEEAAKSAGILQTNRYGELMLKLPFLKSTEDKIEQAFSAHPERKKVCFHFTESIRDGVFFYDPAGMEVFTIRSDKKNLKGFDLYEYGRFVGRIEKAVTISLNPIVDVQKYKVQVRGSGSVLKVTGSTASIEHAAWTMKHKVGKDYIFENRDSAEIARLYSLGYFNYVLDYIDTVDPVEMILAFMATKIKDEEERIKHRKRH